MLTEREKMLAGELYDPLDPELAAARARDLCQDLNATRETESERRRSILRQLFAQGGDTVWMRPPFYSDYGANIELGERVFFNFNCVRARRLSHPNRATSPSSGPQCKSTRHCIFSVRSNAAGKSTANRSTSDPAFLVGGRAIILGGVIVGSRAVIGAGSVVTRNIPEGVFAAGNPCRIIRAITE